jgi:hypothetical protein
MVDAITAISGSSATTPTQVDRSLSITSEPDNKLVATRQSKINDDLAALTANAELQADIVRFGKLVDGESEVEPEGSFEGHHHPQKTTRGETDADASEELLSGESEEIGTVDFDENTPFGHRTAFV